MTLNDLTISPEGFDRETLLSCWEWIFVEPSNPVLLTAMGDAFVQGESGRVYFLDVVGGEISQVSENGQEFEDLLSNVEFVTEYFYPGMIVKCRNAGLSLAPGECYSHKHPLILGGEDTVENIEVTDASVHFSIAGQIHNQVKDLPEGASISDINIS